VPIALIVFYFAETRELTVLALVTLILPLIGVLVTFTLYVNIDTTYGEVNQLYHVSQELFAAMSREETVLKVSQSIAHALCELIARIDAPMVYARNADANEYLLLNIDPGAHAPRTVLPGQGAIGRAALHAGGALIRDLSRQEGLSAAEQAWPPRTTLLIHPLFAEQRTVGLLVLARSGRPFSAEEYRLVSIVANQAGVTLHNAQMFEQSQAMADTDLQLGILNQVAFSQQSERIVGRAQLRNEQISVLLGDIDDFRLVNNTYGHQMGDSVLAGVADVMRQTVGNAGIVGRWGGEEFVVSLPDTGESVALGIAEQIRQRVSARPFHADDGQELHVTISIGVAVFPRDAGDFVGLHKQADRAAYLAKRTGKDQVCLYQDRKALLESVLPATGSGEDRTEDEGEQT
jgi:diguanylate cyclase (GGDEF)-like protein